MANAGNDRTVSGGTGVSLDGSASTPGEGSITGWAWIQTAGIPVTLSDVDKAKAGFNAPQADAADETLVFTLTVTNSLGLTSSDEVTITVQGRPESGDSGEPGEDLEAVKDRKFKSRPRNWQTDRRRLNAPLTAPISSMSIFPGSLEFATRQTTGPSP